MLQKGLGHLAALYLLLLLVARYKLSYHKTICYHLFQYLQRIPCWKPLIISFCSSLGSTLLLIERTTIDPLYLWVIKNLRATHEDLQKENESLRAQQISSTQEGFEPPCLKCLERDKAVFVAKCSTAATIAISSTANVVTNPSAEDTTTIADENARLKTLLETGMYKSLKGHKTLCDVLRKQILN